MGDVRFEVDTDVTGVVTSRVRIFRLYEDGSRRACVADLHLVGASTELAHRHPRQWCAGGAGARKMAELARGTNAHFARSAGARRCDSASPAWRCTMRELCRAANRKAA